MPSDAPPASTPEEEGDQFLGGFSGDDPVDVGVTGNSGVDSTLGALGGIGRWIGAPQPSTTTLGELRSTQDASGMFGSGYRGSDVWSIPEGWDGPRMAQMQILLVEAGLLDPGDLEGTDSPGYYGDATRSAFRDLLTRANASATSWGRMLDRLRANPITPTPDAGGSTQPFVAEVSNPDDVRYAIREGFKAALGKGEIDEERLERMVAAWQGQEVASQRSKFDAMTGGGGTVTATPDPNVWVDMQAKIADPTAYDSRKVVAGADYLARKLRGEV